MACYEQNAAFRITNSVFSSVNLKNACWRNFLWLAKAFGCVTQKILLAKLCFCGIQGVHVDWFRSYLTARKQSGEIKSPYATQSFFL